jgi:DNA repair protein RecO (recombination protein O)
MKSEGIILNTIDYKESSKIVHLYTPFGRISVKALGANKPKNGLLGFTTIGNTVSFVSTDSELPTLMEYNVESSIYKISEDLDRVKVFMIMLDVINHIPEDNNHYPIYNTFKKVLNDLLTENPKKLLCIFLVKMLYAFGIAPNLKTCVSCGSSDISFIDLDKGGALCKNCSNLANRDELYIWKEYYFGKKAIEDFTACNYDAMLKEIRNYYQRYASISLKIHELMNK